MRQRLFTPAGDPKALMLYALRDPSTWSLLVSNALTLGLALSQHWSLVVIMWIYWWQSVVIGFFNFLRILTLKDYSTEGFTINDQPVQPTNATKIGTALFFAVHYGIFHVVYAVFLLILGASGFLGRSIDPGSPPPVNVAVVLVTGVGFIANHAYSFFYNRERDAAGQNIGTVMMAPYARIIPMHLTIIFGALLGGAALPFFIVLKAGADVLMHVREHEGGGSMAEYGTQ